MFRTLLKNIIDSYIFFECSFIKPEVHEKKRLLLLRKDVLGDFILFFPTLKYYREHYSDYEISLVVNTMVTGLSPLFSFIDDLIPYDGKKFRNNFLYRRSFMRHFARKGYDIAIYPVVTREPIGDHMIRLTKAPEKISFQDFDISRDKIYTRLISTFEDQNEVDRNMDFVSKVIGKRCEAVFPTIDLSLIDNRQALNILEQNDLTNKKYVIIFPGAGAFYRTWQLNKFADIVDYIIEKGFTPVICGTVGEEKLGEEILKHSLHKESVVNLIGKTDVASLAHIVGKAVFYFGSETGVLHLATAVGIPVVCILGGGYYGRFFPYGDPKTNRIVMDKDATCLKDHWNCSIGLKPGEIAPCIMNIKVMDAKTQIDELLAVIQHS